MSTRQPWFEVAQALVDVAMGRNAADLVIRNGRWVNVHSGEIISGTDVAILGSRIAYVGPDAGHGEIDHPAGGDGNAFAPELLDEGVVRLLDGNTKTSERVGDHQLYVVWEQ